MRRRERGARRTARVVRWGMLNGSSRRIGCSGAIDGRHDGSSGKRLSSSAHTTWWTRGRPDGRAWYSRSANQPPIRSGSVSNHSSGTSTTFVRRSRSEKRMLQGNRATGEGLGGDPAHGQMGRHLIEPQQHQFRCTDLGEADGVGPGDRGRGATTARHRAAAIADGDDGEAVAGDRRIEELATDEFIVAEVSHAPMMTRGCAKDRERGTGGRPGSFRCAGTCRVGDGPVWSAGRWPGPARTSASRARGPAEAGCGPRGIRPRPPPRRACR